MPPLAPRPGRQRVVRCYKLGLPLPPGYAGALRAGNMPWYKAQRRRSKFRPNKTLARHVCEWRAFKARARSRRPRYVEAA